MQEARVDSQLRLARPPHPAPPHPAMDLRKARVELVAISTACAGLLGAAYALLSYLQKRDFYQIPAVQGGYPFFGQVFKMLRGSPWDTMTDWAREYGGIFRFQLFGSDAVVISDPSILKVVLSTKLSNFKKDGRQSLHYRMRCCHGRNLFVVVWTYKPFMVLLGRGLVTSEGEEWRRQRTLFSHKLRVDILSEIPAITTRAVRRLSDKLDAIKASGGVIEMAEEFRHLTLQVITEILFSLPHDTCDETLAHMYLPIVEEGNLRTWQPQRMYLPTPSWFKFRRDVKVLNDYLTSIISERIQLRKSLTSRKEDLLDFILDNIPQREWGDAWMKQVRDEIKTFVLAGHETSASMLAWSLYELSSRPELLARVRAEALSVFGDRYNDDRFLEEMPKSQLDKLVLTQCCLKESLRLYSVVPTVVRIARESIRLGMCVLNVVTSLITQSREVFYSAEHEYNGSFARCAPRPKVLARAIRISSRAVS